MRIRDRHFLKSFVKSRLDFWATTRLKITSHFDFPWPLFGHYNLHMAIYRNYRNERRRRVVCARYRNLKIVCLCQKWRDISQIQSVHLAQLIGYFLENIVIKILNVEFCFSVVWPFANTHAAVISFWFPVRLNTSQCSYASFNSL